MKAAIRKEFGDQKPRAVVLDDSRQARLMTARKLKSRGFEVSQHATVPEFRAAWKPGTADVIIADWNLSAKASESGDHVLEEVRERDWDVPFVLVSGKLEEADDRAPVLARLLESGSARFVKRGNNGISKACDEAEELIERRDLALLKVILSLRPAALANESVPTTTGAKSVEKLLAEVVARPDKSHDFERPVATSLSAGRRKK
jgi:CheY-like chemotaxis protein